MPRNFRLGAIQSINDMVASRPVSTYCSPIVGAIAGIGSVRDHRIDMQFLLNKTSGLYSVSSEYSLLPF